MKIEAPIQKMFKLSRRRLKHSLRAEQLFDSNQSEATFRGRRPNVQGRLTFPLVVSGRFNLGRRKERK
jgi:hypothetical protein